MPEINLIDRFTRLLRKAHNLEIAFLNTLSEAERSAQGTYENWAPKDLIAHTTYWRRRTIENLAYLARNQQPAEYPEYEQVNRETFNQYRDKNLPSLIKESGTTLTTLLEVLNRFSEDDLTAPDRFPWRNGQPLLSYILNNGYIHVIAHLAAAYIKLGDRPAAERLQESAVEDVTALDPNPASRGLALYDLACLYAGSQGKEKALSLLAEAFKLRPSLIAWSQQDPDLASLHNDPVFQELIQSG
jgi:tetratricopeptide (TPR) repeat protein